MKVLSIRQPWAALIFAGKPGWKNVENREWPTKGRGWIYIHAAKTKVSDSEAKEAYAMAYRAGLWYPPTDDQIRTGGIIGMVRVIDCVRRHSSTWFAGPWGWVLSRPYPLPFEPCAGQPGLWDYGTLPTFKPHA